jgi:hypothetical protein
VGGQVTNIRTTHYIIGSAVGPHPFPDIVRDLQSVIGHEARAQMLNQQDGKWGHVTFTNGPGRLPDTVVACVGGGSNAIGMFTAFLGDADEKDPASGKVVKKAPLSHVRIVGVEAGGEHGPWLPDGTETDKHAATLTNGVVVRRPLRPATSRFDWDFPMRRLLLSRNIEGATDSGRACCTARAPTCCRATTARSRRRTRSRRGWTTPAWDLSTRCSRPRGG